MSESFSFLTHGCNAILLYTSTNMVYNILYKIQLITQQGTVPKY